MFNRTRLGKFHLQVCGTTPCMVRGSEEIIKVIENHLKIKVGETTKDMMFTLSEVECLGACANAPMMQINNHEVYEDLDATNTIELLENLRKGIPVKIGPQTHRINSEGPLGRTCFKESKWVNEHNHITTRDFKKSKEEWDKAKEAAAQAAKEAAAQAAKQSEKK